MSISFCSKYLILNTLWRESLLEHSSKLPLNIHLKMMAIKNITQQEKNLLFLNRLITILKF